jgi:hypothetical protein
MGEKPLHQVSCGKYRSEEDGVRVAQLLLDHGADVNTRRKDHQTPLHVASYFGNVEIVRLELLEGDMARTNLEYRSEEDGVADHGADVNTHGSILENPLHSRVRHGRKITPCHSGNTDLRRMVYVSHSYSLTGARM